MSNPKDKAPDRTPACETRDLTYSVSICSRRCSPHGNKNGISLPKHTSHHLPWPCTTRIAHKCLWKFPTIPVLAPPGTTTHIKLANDGFICQREMELQIHASDITRQVSTCQVLPKPLRIKLIFYFIFCGKGTHRRKARSVAIVQQRDSIPPNYESK